LYKFIFNRFLTFVQNILINQKLSEYHTGYRAFSATVLKSIDYHANSNDFVFDNNGDLKDLYEQLLVVLEKLNI